MQVLLSEQEFNDLKANRKREAQEVLAKLHDGLNTAVRVRSTLDDQHFSATGLKELQRAVVSYPGFTRFYSNGVIDNRKPLVGAEAFSAVTWVNLKDVEDLIIKLKSELK